jgi:hypothetical protein
MCDYGRYRVFYPKSIKLFVRQENSWYHGDLNIIDKNLTQEYKDAGNTQMYKQANE